MNRLWILSIIVVLIVSSSCNKYYKILKSTDNEYKLRMAESYYAKKKYLQAQQIYEDLFTYFKSDPRFEDIYYKYCYCHYYQRNYDYAQNLFKDFLTSFPKSQKADEVDYMRAYCYYKQSPKVDLDQSNTSKAIGAMQTFIANHPGSPKIEEANKIIEECRIKLETKSYKAAKLYYDLGHFRAAAISFANILNDFPDTQKGDLYKLMVIKSDYEFALLSYEDKKRERLEKVIEEYNDFVDRYSDSKLLKEAESYYKLTQNAIKLLSL